MLEIQKSPVLVPIQCPSIQVVSLCHFCAIEKLLKKKASQGSRSIILRISHRHRMAQGHHGASYDLHTSCHHMLRQIYQNLTDQNVQALCKRPSHAFRQSSHVHHLHTWLKKMCWLTGWPLHIIVTKRHSTACQHKDPLLLVEVGLARESTGRKPPNSLPSETQSSEALSFPYWPDSFPKACGSPKRTINPQWVSKLCVSRKHKKLPGRKHMLTFECSSCMPEPQIQQQVRAFCSLPIKACKMALMCSSLWYSFCGCPAPRGPHCGQWQARSDDHINPGPLHHLYENTCQTRTSCWKVSHWKYLHNRLGVPTSFSIPMPFLGFDVVIQHCRCCLSL